MKTRKQGRKEAVGELIVQDITKHTKVTKKGLRSKKCKRVFDLNVNRARCGRILRFEKSNDKEREMARKLLDQSEWMDPSLVFFVWNIDIRLRKVFGKKYIDC